MNVWLTRNFPGNSAQCLVFFPPFSLSLLFFSFKAGELKNDRVPSAVAYGVVSFFLLLLLLLHVEHGEVSLQMSFNGHGARAGNVFWLIPLSTATLEYTQQPNNCGSCPEQTTRPRVCNSVPKSSTLLFRCCVIQCTLPLERPIFYKISTNSGS